jgi:leukotriene-A4 hydrolase
MHFFTRFFVSVFLLASIAFASCKQQTSAPHVVNNHSYSNAQDIAMKHLHWFCKIDFDKKVISATAQWLFTNKTKCTKMVLDVYDLQIAAVRVQGNKVTHQISSSDKILGAALSFPISATDSIVEIDYTTSATATALQWLNPEQTADKKMPYLFTQCESINTRTILPCMDLPSQRITYSADVQVPVGMMALMSAENPQARSGDGKYQFEMPIAVPTYLIALAVGDIDFKAIDARSGVYAEPSVLAKAAAELSDIPSMIEAAEALAGAYRWGRYDVLIQPPSFPIGGMENPKLTFATPTILSGDKSLVSLIAHELAHSWSGNTVTNSSWNDLWLNEGFTTYFERRIMEKLKGTEYTDMLWELSYQDMMADIEDLGDTSADTKLQLQLEGRDPEDAFTNIPYEKGAHLLWLLERTVGRAAFDRTMVAYFNKYAFVPMDTKTCLAFLDSTLLGKNKQWKQDINIQKWVFEPGVPVNCPRPEFKRFAMVDTAAAIFCRGAALPLSAATQMWTTHEYLEFLRKLDRPLNMPQMQALDQRFNFSNTTNSEIAFEWYMLSIASKYSKAYDGISSFLTRVGRKKFVKPLFNSMIEQGKKDPILASLAATTFAKAKLGYHPETAMAVEALFK